MHVEKEVAAGIPDARTGKTCPKVSDLCLGGRTVVDRRFSHGRRHHGPVGAGWKTAKLDRTLIHETILRNHRHADNRRRDDACFGAAAINYCWYLSGLCFLGFWLCLHGRQELDQERSECVS